MGHPARGPADLPVLTRTPKAPVPLLRGRGRSQRVATQQQVYGRLALEELGAGFEVSKTGGQKDALVPVDATGRDSA